MTSLLLLETLDFSTLQYDSFPQFSGNNMLLVIIIYMYEIRRGCQIKPQRLFRRPHMYHNYCARTRPSASVSV